MIIRFLVAGAKLHDVELEGPPFPGDYVSWDGGKTRYLVLDKMHNYGPVATPDMWVSLREFKPFK